DHVQLARQRIGAVGDVGGSRLDAVDVHVGDAGERLEAVADVADREGVVAYGDLHVRVAEHARAVRRRSVDAGGLVGVVQPAGDEVDPGLVGAGVGRARDPHDRLIRPADLVPVAEGAVVDAGELRLGQVRDDAAQRRLVHDRHDAVDGDDPILQVTDVVRRGRAVGGRIEGSRRVGDVDRRYLIAEIFDSGAGAPLQVAVGELDLLVAGQRLGRGDPRV